MDLYDDRERMFLEKGHALLRKKGKDNHLVCALVPYTASGPTKPGLLILLRRPNRFKDPRKLRALLSKTKKRLREEGVPVELKLPKSVCGKVWREGRSLHFEVSSGNPDGIPQVAARLKRFAKDHDAILFKRVTFLGDEIAPSSSLDTDDSAREDSSSDDLDLDAFLAADTAIDLEALARAEQEEDEVLDALLNQIESRIYESLGDDSVEARWQALAKTLGPVAEGLQHVGHGLDAVIRGLEALAERLILVGTEESDPQLVHIGEHQIIQLMRDIEGDVESADARVLALSRASDPEVPGQLRGLAEDVRALIARLGADPRVQACSGSPFGVPVPIDTLLLSPLDRLMATLQEQLSRS